MTEQYIEILTNLLRPSPTNPRTDFGDMESFAADIERRGILVPLVCREHDDDGYHELVLGHRRLRAAEMLGLATVPVIVREMSDKEVIEAQIVENAQRADVHPLDEAEAYARLQRDHGYTLEQVAERLGHTVRHARERTRLLALAEPVRELFRAGKFSPDVAFTIARIPTAETQLKAAKEVAKGHYDGRPLTLKEVRRFIQRDFMLLLASAPFPADDTSLVKGAPACAECPKRSGAQRVLFSELSKKDDLCLDPACFKKKTAAHWKRESSAAKKKGQTVLSAEQCKEVFPHGDYLSYEGRRDYVDAGTSCFEAGDGKKSWKQVLGEHAPRPILARDKGGALHELYPRKAAEKALKKAGHKQSTSTRSVSAQQKEERAQLKRKLKVAEMAINDVGDFPAAEGGAKLLEALAILMLDGIGHVHVQQLAKRRDVTAEELEAQLEDADETWLRSLLLEGMLRWRLERHFPYGKAFTTAMTKLGHDLAKGERALELEDKGKKQRRAKTAKSSTPAKKKTATKPKTATKRTTKRKTTSQAK